MIKRTYTKRKRRETKAQLLSGKRVLALALVFIACLFLPVSETFADTIILEDGRSIQGTILKKDSETITVKTASGIVTTVNRDEVVRIATTEELKKQYEKKLQSVKKDDVNAYLALADWCRKNGLKMERIAALEEVLRINPDDKETSRTLELLKGKVPKEWTDGKCRTAAAGGSKSSAPKKSGGNKVIVVGKGGSSFKGGKGSPCKPEKAKKVLAKSLAYLAKEQAKAGFWSTKMCHVNGQVVTTSLCALAMMAAGSTPAKGPYCVNVNRAVEFVMNTITKKTPLDGRRNGANWNQENWRLGFGGVFLAEAYASHKDPRIKAKLQEVVQRLEANQEASGGWAHGPGGPNSLGYLELEIMSNWAVAAIGMAKQLGCKVDSEKLKKALDYVNQCTSGMGATAYSTRANQRGTGCPGRTGGAILGFAMCRYNSPKLDKMAKYLGKTMEQIPEGHASPALHVVGGGLGAIQVSKGLWDKYVTTLYPKILELAQDDGSFRHITNKEGDSDAKLGPCYTTGAFAFMLAVDLGRLSFLSGKYGKGRPDSIAGTSKKDTSG
ncbi:MAG: DUF6288 domain-containing protein [Planctomycetota bacterium]|jgi:hypothetical protein